MGVAPSLSMLHLAMTSWTMGAGFVGRHDLTIDDRFVGELRQRSRHARKTRRKFVPVARTAWPALLIPSAR
jgi:hypothetical protein